MKKKTTTNIINYFINYTSLPIVPNNIVIYSNSNPVDFIAFKYRRDILDENATIIGDASYDVQCNNISYSNNDQTGMINGTFNSVQTFTYKNKNYVVYIQGKINFTLFGIPFINRNSPLNFITNAQLINEATTNVFVNDLLFTNVGLEALVAKQNPILTSYNLIFNKAIKTNNTVKN
jgi:hypothetical protein